MYFRNYTLQKAQILKCLKSPASEHLWRDNMLKSPKHCRNLHGLNFVRLVVSEILRLFVNVLFPNDKLILSVKVSV